MTLNTAGGTGGYGGSSPRERNAGQAGHRTAWTPDPQTLLVGYVNQVTDAPNEIDPEFAALPLRELADAALSEAKKAGAQHADFRAERIQAQHLRLSDAKLQALADADDAGFAVRVIVDGTWGFAGAVDLTPEAARAAARQAVEVAKVAAAMNTEHIELASEPGY